MRSRILFAPLVIAALAVSFACGGGGDDDDGDIGPIGDTASTPTPFPNDTSASPELEGPPSLYAISQDDLGIGYITDIDYTYVLTADSYGMTSPFQGVDGPGMLQGWGYLGGYETSYTPEGRSTAVLNGAHTIKVETHLLADEEGAKALFAYFRDFVAGTVSEPVTAHPLGNEFAAWRYIDRENGVAGSDIPGEFHQYIFRRGNLVAAVQTWGAEPFIDVHAVYELAHIIDGKALGTVARIEPTPVATRVGTGN